jgi:hypothetical protein
MTKNPGARYASARSISRGWQTPAARIIRAFLVLALRSSAPLPGTCARERSSSACPGSPMPAAPGCGPSRGHTAPVRARPARCRESRRPRASGPAVAALVPACRVCQHAAHAAAVPAEPRPGLEGVEGGSAQRINASNAGGSRDPQPHPHCRCPGPWSAADALGVPAPPTSPP